MNKDKFKEIFNTVYEFVYELGAAALFVFLLLTFPLWAIPYAIIKGLKRKWKKK